MYGRSGMAKRRLHPDLIENRMFSKTLHVELFIVDTLYML
jgi:hypothetical protein